VGDIVRKRWIQDPKTGQFIPEEEYVRPGTGQAPMVMGDIEPYRNMVDGRVIGSRSHHRRFLRDHGLIEVGNEKMTPPKYKPAPGLKEDIRRAMGD
jgi:hypothetical protein